MQRTFDTGRGCVLERVLGDVDGARLGRGVGNRADLGGALAEVRPLVRGRVGEAVGHGAVGAVDDTRAARVLDAGDRLFILGAREPSCSADEDRRQGRLTGFTVWGMRPLGAWPADSRKIWV